MDFKALKVCRNNQKFKFSENLILIIVQLLINNIFVFLPCIYLIGNLNFK